MGSAVLQTVHMAVFWRAGFGKCPQAPRSIFPKLREEVPLVTHGSREFTSGFVHVKLLHWTSHYGTRRVPVLAARMPHGTHFVAAHLLTNCACMCPHMTNCAPHRRGFVPLPGGSAPPVFSQPRSLMPPGVQPKKTAPSRYLPGLYWGCLPSQ